MEELVRIHLFCTPVWEMFSEDIADDRLSRGFHHVEEQRGSQYLSQDGGVFQSFGQERLSDDFRTVDDEGKILGYV